MKHRLRLRLNEANKGTVTIDGIPISASRIVVDADVETGVEVTITLPHVALDLDARAKNLEILGFKPK